MAKRRHKHKSKVELPTDRNGKHIDVGDIVAWDCGEAVKIETLTYLGDEFADTIGSWIANIETDGCDNLSGSKRIWKGDGR